MNVFSIGFTQKNAETFFTLLRNEDIKSLLDVRLNNVSQLSGFAKKDNLAFFLRELCQIEYFHLPELAPTKDIMDAYKKENMEWDEFSDRFRNLMVKRNIEHIDRNIIQSGCFLCSEHLPHYCHRSLVIDYLNDCWGSNFTIKHL